MNNLLRWLACGLVTGIAAQSLAQPVLPARLVPGDDIVGAAPGDQTAPSIARGGLQYLAVWQDNRAAVSGESATGNDIYGIRLNAAGNPIEETAFPIVAGPADQTSPKAVWNGQNWLVVYDSTGPGATGYYSSTLQAVRVSAAGVVLDKTPLTLSVGHTARVWTVVTDGHNWTVFYQGSDTGTDLWGARISPAGQLLDEPAKLVLPSTYYLRFGLTAAYSQGVYLLAWQDLSDLKGIRLNMNLEVQDAGPRLLVPANQSLPALAGNGGGFFLVWQQQQADTTLAVVGSRIQLDGAVQDQAGINISRNSPATSSGFGYDVIWNGANWLVFWPFNGTALARVSPAGAVLDPGGIKLPAVPFGRVALSANGGFLFVSTVSNSTNVYALDVQSMAVSNSLLPGPLRLLSLSPPVHSRPDAAAGSAGALLVYRSATSSANRILAQPFDGAGQPLGAGPVKLDEGDRLSGPDLPAIAWNGSLYLAVWFRQDRGGIVGMRIRQDGTLVDAAPFFILPGTSPDVAALGETFLVVGTHAPAYPQFVEVYGRRVSGATGAVLDSSSIYIGASFARTPAVTALGGRWLVAWQQNWSHDNTIFSIAAAFVTPEGTVTQSVGVSNPMSLVVPRGPSLISNGAGTQALIVYETEKFSATETDVVHQRLSADGVLLDPPEGVAVTNRPGNQFRTQAVWNGREYVVAWQDQRNRLSILDAVDARSDVFAARISETGVVLDANGFAVAATAGGDVFPWLWARSDGGTAIGAAAWTPLGHRLHYDFHPGGNQWPTVNAQALPAAGSIPLAVAFNSLGTADRDGSVVSYDWDFGNGATATGASPTHTYTSAGDYIVTLTARDNAGAASRTALLVRASTVNLPPVAIATADRLSGPAPLSVTLSATLSYDPDGTIGNFRWNFSSGGEVWGSTAYHTFTTPGTHTATLTVIDDRGATGTATLTFTVGPLNAPPVVKVSANPLNGKAPLAVQFSSAGSYDPDGAITSYLWDLGEGPSSTLPNPAKTYSVPGTYLVKLTVTDNRGVSTTSNPLTISVFPALTPIKCIGITLNGRTVGEQERVAALATWTDSQNVALTGVLVTAEWTLPDGSRSTQTVATLNGSAIFTSQGGKGVYTLRILNAVKAGAVFDRAASVLSGSITR